MNLLQITYIPENSGPLTESGIHFFWGMFLLLQIIFVLTAIYHIIYEIIKYDIPVLAALITMFDCPDSFLVKGISFTWATITIVTVLCWAGWLLGTTLFT